MVAEDVAGNLSAPSNEASATVASGPPPGLLAAWGFDEGSGTTTADQSGTGNNGTLSNATWSATGKFGKALSFNGTNASVTVPDSNSLDLTTGMTLEGWVRPTVSNDWQTLIVKERPGELVYGLYSSTDANRPQSQVTVGGSARLLNGTATIPAGAWTHVAATYDGTTQRLYVNGTQVSTLATTGTIMTSTSPLKIGGNTIWSEWFNGLIDEVRVYGRALSASEIQTDMNASISSPDSVAPSAPGVLGATGGLGQVSLAWGAATDNVAVARYNVHRSTTVGFVPSAVNRIAQPTATTYVDTGLAPGVYYYRVLAEDAAGNVGPASNQANATATADTTAPTAPTGLGATPAPGQISLTWGASTDAAGIARYNVHRGTTAGFVPSAGNRIAQPTGTSYIDSGLVGGTYYYRVTAEDPAGNVSAPSGEANALVPTGPPAGLVGEWGFDAGVGTTAADQSGSGNTGTLSGAAWTTAGRYGNALSFDGTNDLVTIADANSLDLANGMTLEAWVRPTALGNAWRTALMKESAGSLSYALYAAGTDGTKVPDAEIFSGGFRTTGGSTPLALNTWTHIASTFDGNALKLFVNGTQASQLLFTGSITTSTGALRVGGNNVWGEWFQGEIDEVRVYNRALGGTEIQADMNRPVTNPDTAAPTAPGTLTATGNLTSAQLNWGPATDLVGVARYNVHRSTTPAFTPAVGNRIAQPTGTSYADTVAPGTYYYKVTAEDAAGNVGPASNEASALVGDNTPPGAPGTLSAVGGVGKATLSWGAAGDNVGVVRYNVHRGSPGFTPSPANRIAQPATPGYVDTVAAGSYAYRVTAEDAAGNVGPASNESTATVTSDTTAPTAPTALGGSVVGSTVNLSWTGSTDAVGVVRYNVHRSTNAGFTPTAGNRIAQPTGTSYSDSGLASGTYYYKVTAEDAAGNLSGASNESAQTVADGTPPSAPSGAGALAAGSTVSVSWTAATDNLGVARYNVHRGGSSGFTPSLVNRIAQPTGTTYADPGLAPGTYFYKVFAEDAAGNIGPVSNTASATVLDTAAPSTPGGLGAVGGAGQAALSWAASSDNVGVLRYNVHRSTTSGFTPAVGNRVAQPTGTSHTDPGLAAGTYYYRVTAEDAAGNISPASSQASAVVSAPPVTGLVAAYGFDTGSGTSATDQSGAGNTGAISGATWTTDGRYGQALSFDGINDLVTITDAPSLDLTTGMTLEAWVRPTNLGSDWRTALMKEATGSMTYGLYAHGGDSGTKVPVGEIVNGGFRMASGASPLTLNTWAHLATTYDGTTLRLFVNGVQAGQLAIGGSITTSAGALRIGGNNTWGEWFQGDIDEVRVYNRALNATELQADMNTSVSAPDSQAPSAPGTLSATGGLGQIVLAWGAATDNVGVSRYNVHRGTSAGFTPSVGNRIAQPAGTGYTNSGLAAGHLLLQGHGRGLRGQRRCARERGERGRHCRLDAADRGYHSARTRSDGRRDGRGQRERVGQRHGRWCAVQGRRREPWGRGHVCALLGLVGHLHSRKRPAHALRRCTRCRRQHSSGRECARDRVEHGRRRSRRRVGFRRGERHRRVGPVRAGKQRDAHKCHVDDSRQVQQRSDLQRDERLGLRARLRHARPDHRHDARSLGAAGRQQLLADSGDEGAAREPRLRALFEHEHEPSESRDLRRREPANARGHEPAPRRHVEPPGSDVRRRDTSPLRQRRPGRPARHHRRDPDLHRPAPDRRQRHLGRVVQRADRRGARLQPRSQRGRGPGGHEPERDARHGAADDLGEDACAELGRHQRRDALRRRASTSR